MHQTILSCLSPLVNITGSIRAPFLTAIAGSSYAVRCTITVDVPVPRLRIVWADSNGTKLTSTGDFNTTVNGTEASLELLFDQLMLSNAGLYTCMAIAEDNDGGSLSTSEQHVIVVQGTMFAITHYTNMPPLLQPESLSTAAKPSVLVRDSLAGRHIEGTNLTLTCSTTVSDTSVLTVEAISWSSSSSGIITQNSSHFSLIPTTEQTGGVFLSTLSIYTLTIEEDNMTDYTCTVTLVSLSDLILGNTAKSTFTVMVEGMVKSHCHNSLPPH